MAETETKKGPIEVWLSKSNIAVTCRIVREDESTYLVDVDALTIRGAEREITGWLLDEGYEPADRWVLEGRDEQTGDNYEVSRTFRPAKAKP